MSSTFVSQDESDAEGNTDTAVECVFLGTGTSSSIPLIDCLTAPPGRIPCETCISTLTPEGKCNIRRNTSALFRLRGKTIVIDVGKSFLAAAHEWFPKYGFRKIDAVLITHAHADAVNGLDDLRGWTIDGSVQSHIDLYASQSTYQDVARSFPYLVAKEYASGGGDVPEFVWHIFEDKVPFKIEGTDIEVTAFTVHHGRIFSVFPPPANRPTPCDNLPSPLPSGRVSPVQTPKLPDLPSDIKPKIHPYLCFGFKILETVIYISDVSHIPDDAWSIMKPSSNAAPLPLFILDCLRIEPHISHIGLIDSINIARRMKATRTYLTGFGHEMTFRDWTAVGRVVQGDEVVEREHLTKDGKKALDLVPPGDPIWLRPSVDGLRVFVSSAGEVSDSG